VQVVASTPQATGRLLTLCPDVVERLAVITVRKNTLCFVRLSFDCNVAKA
jgi:hypothetical protein